MEDNAEPTFDLNDDEIVHLSWRDVDAELGEWSWIVPRRSDCVRSFGYLRAAQLGTDVIVTLDDDCFPTAPGFIDAHVAALSGEATTDAWTSTGEGVVPRGVPYLNRGRSRPVGISHGLWTNVADYDAITQLVIGRTGGTFAPRDLVVPVGQYYPMCGMNLAWRAELTPAMYFLLMGRGLALRPLRRHLGGASSRRRICDHLGYAVVSGRPLIEHRRASNVWTNLAKEAPGLPVNETLWRAVDAIVLTETSVAGCYQQIARELDLDGDYWSRLGDAMCVWADLASAAIDARRAGRRPRAAPRRSRPLSSTSTGLRVMSLRASIERRFVDAHQQPRVWGEMPLARAVALSTRYRAAAQHLYLTGNERRLAALKDRHRGERCFILGNGPSLNDCDLTRLAGETTFGVNGIFLKTAEMGFVPTYYVVEDILVARIGRNRSTRSAARRSSSATTSAGSSRATTTRCGPTSASTTAPTRISRTSRPMPSASSGSAAR